MHSSAWSPLALSASLAGLQALLLRLPPPPLPFRLLLPNPPSLPLPSRLQALLPNLTLLPLPYCLQALLLRLLDLLVKPQLLLPLPTSPADPLPTVLGLPYSAVVACIQEQLEGRRDLNEAMCGVLLNAVEQMQEDHLHMHGQKGGAGT